MRYFEKQAINRREFIGQLGSYLGKAVGETRSSFKNINMTRRQFLPVAALKTSVTVSKYSPANVSKKGLTALISDVGSMLR